MRDRRSEDLARELACWAQRPGSLPPGAARTRVLARLPRRRRRPLARLVSAGAVLAAIALAVTLAIERSGEPPARPTQIAAPAPAAEGGPRMILHELSSGTRLYIVMRPEVVADEC